MQACASSVQGRAVLLMSLILYTSDPGKSDHELIHPCLVESEVRRLPGNLFHCHSLFLTCIERSVSHRQSPHHLVRELDLVFIASTIALLQWCKDRLHGLIYLTEPVDSNDSTTSNVNSRGEDDDHYKF